MLKEFKYYFNGFPIEHVEHEGDIFFHAGSFFSIASNFQKVIKISEEVRNVSRHFLFKKVPSGRNSANFINSDGIIQVLSRKTSYSEAEKDSALEFLRENNLTKQKIIFLTRKEKIFYDELKDFFSNFNINVKTQVSLGDGICVDFVINNIAIEYDESMHYPYDKDKEKEREREILKHYVKIIRVNDKKSNGYNIGKIIEQGVKLPDAVY